MELFELMRRDREAEGVSIRELARRHGVHRRAVRQALAAAAPPERARPARRPAPALGPHHELIDQWLSADRQAPRKQRHTARRIWQRLVEERGAQVAETTVRARRRQIGMPGEAYCAAQLLARAREELAAEPVLAASVTIEPRPESARPEPEAVLALESQVDPTDGADPTEMLRRLAELHDAGILDDEEFRTAKGRLLSRI